MINSILNFKNRGGLIGSNLRNKNLHCTNIKTGLINMKLREPLNRLDVDSIVFNPKVVFKGEHEMTFNYLTTGKCSEVIGTTPNGILSIDVEIKDITLKSLITDGLLIYGELTDVSIQRMTVLQHLECGRDKITLPERSMILMKDVKIKKLKFDGVVLEDIYIDTIDARNDGLYVIGLNYKPLDSTNTVSSEFMDKYKYDPRFANIDLAAGDYIRRAISYTLGF